MSTRLIGESSNRLMHVASVLIKYFKSVIQIDSDESLNYMMDSSRALMQPQSDEKRNLQSSIFNPPASYFLPLTSIILLSASYCLLRNVECAENCEIVKLSN